GQGAHATPSESLAGFSSHVARWPSRLSGSIWRRLRSSFARARHWGAASAGGVGPLERSSRLETALVASVLVLWLVVLCNVLLTLALVRRLNHMGTGQPSAMGLKTGALAPDFTAYTLSGATTTRADFLGRSVALVFVS